MTRRGLSHEEIKYVLDKYAETGVVDVPKHALEAQNQKLDLITTIIPQELLREYTFFFAFFDDLAPGNKQQTIENIDTEKRDVIEYFTATRMLRQFGEINQSEQELLASMVVENLERLA